MALSRDKYVPNNSENIKKLVRKVMKFYAYKPSDYGQEPIGKNGRILFKSDTNEDAINHTESILGNRYMLFSYTTIYKDKKKYKLVMASV